MKHSSAMQLLFPTATLLVSTSLAALIYSCSPVPDDPDVGKDARVTDVDVGHTEAADTSPPSHAECAATTSERECVSLGCEFPSDVEFYEHTEDSGCQEGDGFICLSQLSGNDRSGFYWRERGDGTHVAWSFRREVWPSHDDTWTNCFAEFSPACACDPLWNPVYTPDMGRDSGGESDAGLDGG